MKMYIIAVSMTISISACTKNANDNSATARKLDPNFLEYVKLPLNAYMIFEDSATGQQDSVVVAQSEIYNVKVDVSIAGVGGYTINEKLYLTLRRKNGRDSVYLEANAVAPYSASDPTDLMALRKDYFNLETVFTYPGPTMSVIVAQKQYNDVIAGGFYETQYYWAKSKGLIMIVRTVNGIRTVHSLVRSGQK